MLNSPEYRGWILQIYIRLVSLLKNGGHFITLHLQVVFTDEFSCFQILVISLQPFTVLKIAPKRCYCLIKILRDARHYPGNSDRLACKRQSRSQWLFLIAYKSLALGHSNTSTLSELGLACHAI